MSKLEDLRKVYNKLEDREMPEELRDQIYSMIEEHRQEEPTVSTNSKRQKSWLFKRMGVPIASGIAIAVVLGVVTGVLIQSHQVIPVLGGYQKNVTLNQAPKNIRLTIEAIESFDGSLNPYMATHLTETRENVFSHLVYHVDVSGKFPIQKSLPHQSGQKFPQIQRLMLSIPADDNYVSLQGYAADKVVYEKKHLPVVNKQWTFAGRNSLWQATYTVDSSAVKFPKSTYIQITDSHYMLRYLGENGSTIGRVSYAFSFPQSSYNDYAKLPSSGVISEGGLEGGGVGGMMDYSGEHGTLKVSWDNKNTVIPLNMSKQGMNE